MRTRTACVATQGELDMISGHESNSVETLNACQLECEKYKWCRGIAVSYSNNNYCRLLTNYTGRIDGLRYLNHGN